MALISNNADPVHAYAVATIQRLAKITGTEPPDYRVGPRYPNGGRLLASYDRYTNTIEIHTRHADLTDTICHEYQHYLDCLDGTLVDPDQHSNAFYERVGTLILKLYASYVTPSPR